MNSSPWGFTSGFNTVSAPAHFSDQVLDTETTGAVKYNERCNPSIDAEKLNMGRKVDEDLFPSNSSFGLSMSHVPEAPGSGLNYGSLRKVKVNHVKDSENVTPSSMGHGYNRVASSAMFTTQSFCKEEEDPVSTALASGIGDGNIISSATSDLGESNSVMSIGNCMKMKVRVLDRHTKAMVMPCLFLWITMFCPWVKATKQMIVPCQRAIFMAKGITSLFQQVTSTIMTTAIV